MELQDSVEKAKTEKEQITSWWTESNNKLNALKSAISSISQLA